MIVTLGATKGGVGKSTISCNLAVCAAQKNKSVLLVDCDHQGSTMAFRALRKTNDIKAVQITEPILHKDLSSYKYDLIFVDVGGRHTNVLRSAIMATDLLLIPCLPSAVDFWAAEDTIEILAEARSYKDINARFVLNQVIANTRLSVDIDKAIKTMEDDAPLLKSRLHSRIAFKNALAEGSGVTEKDDQKAAAEIEALYEEIMTTMKGV